MHGPFTIFIIILDNELFNLVVFLDDIKHVVVKVHGLDVHVENPDIFGRVVATFVVVGVGALGLGCLTDGKFCLHSYVLVIDNNSAKSCHKTHRFLVFFRVLSKDVSLMQDIRVLMLVAS